MLNFSANMNKLKNQNSGDRFIPLRRDQNIDILKSETDPEFDIIHNVSFVNYAKIRYNRTNYRNALKSVLFPKEFKILNFHSPKPFNPNEKKIDIFTSWPCKPRKKPVIGPPDMILDMPDFDSHIAHQIADWSSKNCIATIYEGEVHLFDPNSDFRDETQTGNRAYSCVKWHKSGTKLAVGLYPPYRVGIWDISLKKILKEEICCRKLCEIFALEWINDDLLATGCSSGFINLRNLQLKSLKKIRAARKAIICIVCSCDGKYLASGSMEENVKLWKLPNLEKLGIIETPPNIRALAWHPWKYSILAVGYTFDTGRVTIWNVNTCKILKTETAVYKNSSVDALTFNPISGELVVSYFVQLDREKGIAIISILADLDRVVEELHIHNGPVRYLMWGKDNHFLATAGGDEHLCIWKFFDKPLFKENILKPSKKQTLLSQIEKSCMFRPVR